MMVSQLIRNTLIATAFALPMVSLNVQSALARHLDFTLVNNNDLSIWEINVSPNYSNRWGPDILGEDVLPSGKSTRVTFPYSNPSSPCVYDIKVVYSNQTYDVTKENLCEVDFIETWGYGGNY